jgi:hypothetical protein
MESPRGTVFLLTKRAYLPVKNGANKGLSAQEKSLALSSVINSQIPFAHQGISRLFPP